MESVFIGRQAIFDRTMEVYAYELLYRESSANSAALQDGDQASSRVMLHASKEIGLDRIAGDRRIFLNLTRNLLIDPQPIPFDRERVVLEILEDIQIDEQLVQCASTLASEGYTLALDDYEFDARWDSLLPHVHIIKVEVSNLDWNGLERRIAELRRRDLILLAEKVETESEYRRLHELGFDLFQGFFFSRPQVIAGKRLSENQVITLKLLARLNDPSATPGELEELICQDPGLVYKILRYLNSASLALPRKVKSIQQAIVYMGVIRLRSWASLIILSRMENKPEDILTNALVRAHMCSLLARKAGENETESAFTAGLLSVLDLLMDSPLEEIVGEIPLADPIREAMLQHTGLLGEALHCTLAFEHCDWGATRFQGLQPVEIQEIYLQSSHLAFQEGSHLLG